MLFAKGKPLGKKGFEWLKTHCINLTELKKKSPVAERLAYADEVMEDILGRVFSMDLTDALSFYGSKIILDQPNHFGRVPIVLNGSNSFWSGQNHFGQVQIIKISREKSNLTVTKMLWT